MTNEVLPLALTFSESDLHSRFPANYVETHSVFTQSALRPAWQLDLRGDSELAVSNGVIEFRDAFESKHSFSFSIRELRSLERRHGPLGFPVLRLKLHNGKKFELVPRVIGVGHKCWKEYQKQSDQAADAMEKAIKDMASRRGIVPE